MATYKSRYGDEIKAVKDEIAARKEFSYSPENDPAYRQYEKSYRAQALAGMKNTLAENAALTGGYANSYAQTAAQKEYSRVMDQLGSVIPELYEAAYSRYRDSVSDKYARLDALSKLDEAEYSHWRDSEDDELTKYLKANEAALQRELKYADLDQQRELKYADLDLRYADLDLERELKYADLDQRSRLAELEREAEAEKNRTAAERYADQNELARLRYEAEVEQFLEELRLKKEKFEYEKSKDKEEDGYKSEINPNYGSSSRLAKYY